MAAPAHLLSAVVFIVFQLRHAISWALALYPGESWLWRLSFTIGYDLLPVLSLLRDGLNLGFVGTFAVLAGLAMASYAKNLFAALLVLHVATFACGYCCLIAILRHPTALDVGVQSLKMADISATVRPLQALCLGLLVACGHGHWRYWQRLGDHRIFRALRGAEHGIVGAGE
ncbi:MAG TPA: hypothetical protein VFR19_06040 [Hyphomicrobiaceae bacterium]|nr:hypothetical protein [Hyphomicrobiaceae bacterium]